MFEPTCGTGMVSKQEIVQRSCDAIFGRPLVTNVYRSVLVEAIVASYLPDWQWVSADYASYDFQHSSGKRLEVKQSAMKQSWQSRSEPKPSWDIKPRTGSWIDGATWVPGPGRNADIYVLGLHDLTDASADHREPTQWKFFVLATSVLPETQRLSLAKAKSLTNPVPVDGLANTVGSILALKR